MAYIIILINLVIFTSGFVSTDSSCGDWTSYQDEKCFKVIDTLTPFSGAAQVCQKEGANIGIIRSAEEQGLVETNLKNQSIVDNVWIGIKKNGKSFLTLDENALKYTNWANGRPHNQTDVDCVEVSVDDENKWIDVKCEKKNAVLCEKNQQWSNAKVENVLKQIRQNYSEKMDSLEKKIDNLERNPVPIGFIYVQLSGQSEPHTLWPQTEWNNISSKYAGLFFRAEGGKADSFGGTQREQARTLQVMHAYCSSHPHGCNLEADAIDITNSFNDKPFYTGDDAHPFKVAHDYGLNFRYTTEENRPRNQAMRIWIRIK